MKRVLFFVLTAVMLGGTVNSVQAQREIFLRKMMQVNALPNERGSIHLEADHYGYTLGLNNPCTYTFYVVDQFTNQAVVSDSEWNMKTITLPSNGGRLVMDLDIKLPEGRYAIYYEWQSVGSPGPRYFWNFVIGNPPPLPAPPAVKNASITDTWLSVIDDGEPTCLQSSALISENTIYLYPREWHSNLADAEVSLTLTEACSLSLNGQPVTSGNGTDFTFRTDLANPVPIALKANDDGDIVNYILTVRNPEGNRAGLSWVNLIWNGQVIESTNSWGSDEFTVSLPAGMPDYIGDDEFELEVHSGINTSVTIDGQPVESILKYCGSVNDSYSYGGKLGGFKLANMPCDITVTSPDGTVTKPYTVRIAEAPADQGKAPVWINEQYQLAILGFAYSDDPYRYPIEDPIPIESLPLVGIQLSIRDDLPEEEKFPEVQGDGMIVLRTEVEEGETRQEYRITEYPQPGNNDPYVISFRIMESIPAGRYEVVLVDNQVQIEYKLGGITLTDVAPEFYGLNIGTFAGGSVSIGNKTESTAGKTIEVWATPEPEHELLSVSVTGEGGDPIFLTSLGGTGNYSFIMPDCDVTITATFIKMTDEAAIEEAKRILLERNGEIENGSAGDIEDEEGLKEVILNGFSRITVSTGITFTAADIEIVEINQDGSYTYTVKLAKGNASEIITVTNYLASNERYFEILSPATSVGGGGISANVMRAKEGTVITLEASPHYGYELESITACKAADKNETIALEGTGNTRTFTMPAYTIRIEATFKLTDEEQVKVDEDAVEAAKEDIESVEGGTYQVAQVTGNTEDEIKAWLRQTLGMLFAEKHNIQLRSDVETQIIGELIITEFTPAVAGTVADADGTDGAFSFVVELTRNGTAETTTEASGIIKAVAYEAPPATTYIITASAGEHGSITPEGAVTVDEGGNRTFTFTPDAGYEVAEVTVDGQPAAVAGSYTFTNVSANHSIAVSFRPSPPVTYTYAIFASAGEHGSITPEGTIAVDEGSSQTFTITPDEGYEMAEVTVDGQSVDAVDGSYTFTGVVSDHSITVTFAPITTGNAEMNAGLNVRTQGGRLHVSGLTAGKLWSVYAVSGATVYHGTAHSSEATIPLPGAGVYIVKANGGTVKTVN